MSQVHIEEMGDFVEVFLRFGHMDIGAILTVRLTFPDLQHGLHTSSAQLAMHAYSKRKIQITRAASEDRWRESVNIAVDRRKQGIFEVMAVRVKQRCGANEGFGRDENVVYKCVRKQSIAGPAKINCRCSRRDRPRHGQVFSLGSQQHCDREAPACGRTEDTNVLWLIRLEQLAINC